MIFYVCVFVIVAVLLFFLIGKIPGVTSILPPAVSKTEIAAANLSNNAAVDAVAADLAGLRLWLTSPDAKTHIDALAAENESYRVKEAGK